MKTYTVSESFIPNPIWVSPSGSDETGDGTETNPFRQIQYACNKARGLGRNINVNAGEYNGFSVSQSPVINIHLLGDVNIINGNNIDSIIMISHNSIVTIRESNYNFIIDCSYDKNCITVTHNSFFAYHSGNLILKNLNLNNKNIIYTNAHSMSYIRCNINYQGTVNLQGSINIFSTTHGSNLSWIPPSTTNLGNIPRSNATALVFGKMNGPGDISLLGSNINISNTFTHGLYTDAGFICANIGSNNATTPLVQANGGRVFLGSSTSTTNSISPSPQILDITSDSDIALPEEAFFDGL